jgi:DNA-directed RNA polymerase subunit K/omega
MLRLMSDMDETTPIADQPEPEAPQIPSEPAPPIDSRFLFVDVAALRAKQLRRGARPRLGEEAPQVPHKAERVAMEEVRRGLVYYDVPQPRAAEAGSAPGGAESSRA